MFPLSTVLFPHAELPLHVFEPRYRVMTERCLDGDGEFGVVLIQRGSEVGGGDERHVVGTVAAIEEAAALPDGRWVLLTRGTSRFLVTEWLPDDPHPLALVEPVAEPTEGADDDTLGQALASVRRARALLSELGQALALPEDLGLAGRAETRAWQLCSLAPLSVFDRQRLLEVDGPMARLAALIELTDALAEDLSALLAGG
jgi:uncharacterized protein